MQLRSLKLAGDGAGVRETLETRETQQTAFREKVAGRNECQPRVVTKAARLTGLVLHLYTRYSIRHISCTQVHMSQGDSS